MHLKSNASIIRSHETLILRSRAELIWYVSEKLRYIVISVSRTIVSGYILRNQHCLFFQTFQFIGRTVLEVRK